MYDAYCPLDHCAMLTLRRVKAAERISHWLKVRQGEAPPPCPPASCPHLAHLWAARIPGWTKPLRFQLGKNQHPGLGRPPAASPLLCSPWIIYSKSPAINTHLGRGLAPRAPSPPAPAAGTLLGSASVQSVCRLSLCAHPARLAASQRAGARWHAPKIAIVG